MKNAADETVGIKAACRILNLTESSVRRLIDRGSLTATRDDMDRRRFQVAELHKLAKQRATR